MSMLALCLGLVALIVAVLMPSGSGGGAGAAGGAHRKGAPASDRDRRVMGLPRGVQSGSVRVLSPAQVFERVRASVVLIVGALSDGSGLTQGSGLVISPNVVATNRHIVASANRLGVLDGDGQRLLPVRLLCSDWDRDLSLFEVPDLAAPAVELRGAQDVTVGERVFAVGSPRALNSSISEGLVSGLRAVQGHQVIQTTAAISPGSSGGGLFDTSGRLIGMTSFTLGDSQNLNFALPAEWLSELSAFPQCAR